MAKIRCPKCGEVFTVDEKDYSDILMQIKNEEFEKELNARLALIKEQNKSNEELIKEQLKNEHEQELNEIKLKLQALEAEKKRLEENNQKELENRLAIVKAENAAERAELESSYKAKLQKAENNLVLEKNNTVHSIETAIKDKEAEVNQLKNDLKLNEQKAAMEQAVLEKRHKEELRLKEDEVAYYKDLKAKTSVKLLGETLEQHCLVEFNKMRMNSYPHAKFEKDNDVVEGTKGDFVFRDWTDDGAELISIMFDMKNEADVSVNKKKNEDHFKKLDEDRRKKGCEYAVLVSLLEPDNEYYNTGIVDVSWAYPKMFVIRPQFFVPFIGLLYNAAKNSEKEKNELLRIKNQNIDISKFEDKLLEFQDSLGKNYVSAKNNFAKAIDEIDKTINHLTKVKESLLTTDNQIRLLNDKVQDLTIRKLTYQNPTMKELFDQARKDKKNKPENDTEVIEAKAEGI